MPGVARSLKVARLAVQHLGPPLVRAVLTLAGGVVANMAENAGRPCAWGDDTWLMETTEDVIAGRTPGEPDFGTHYLPAHLERQYFDV